MGSVVGGSGVLVDLNESVHGLQSEFGLSSLRSPHAAQYNGYLRLRRGSRGRL